MSEERRKAPRYRFADFVVSPSRRLLLRDGETVPLIPRYCDLLLLLLERRNEAVHRHEILERVWSDVVVSDGALSQGVRVLRRALGDDPRSPRFILTVSRHGYRFVFPAVAEETDERPLGGDGAPAPLGLGRALGADQTVEAAVRVLLDGEAEEADQREAAEALHAIGTDVALRRIDRLPGHPRARAILRDSRWSVPAAGAVPIFGQPGAVSVAWELVKMRAGRAVQLAGRRWLGSVAGGALIGLVAGALGGLVLRFGPGSTGVDTVVVALPVIGTVLGGVGAAGVGGGLALAETVLRSWRGVGLVVFGAAGGGLVGLAADAFVRIALQVLFGSDLSPVMGAWEGFVLGGAAGLGYALGTPTSEGGMATPRGRARLLAAALAGLCCAAAGVALAAGGSYLGAMSLEFLAEHFRGSDVSLVPVARVLGEREPGEITNFVLSGCEGFLFAFGLTLGLTRRPH